MFCDNCGTKLEEGSKFCSSCGKGLTSNRNNNVGLNSNIDKEKVKSSLLDIKEQLIKLVKNPFNGIGEAYSVLSNSYTTKLLILIFAVLYGVIWKISESMVGKAILDKYIDDFGPIEVIMGIMMRLLGLSGELEFWKISLVFLIALGIIAGLIYLVCNNILNKKTNIYELINVGIFTSLFVLIGIIVSSIAIYVGSTLYILVLLATLIFATVYLYHNICYVINENGNESMAVYITAVCFVLIVYVHNIIVLDNDLLSLTDMFKYMMKDIF